MTTAEFEEYCSLSSRIGKYYSSKNDGLIQRAEMLAIERARIMNNSENKKEWLREKLVSDDFDYSLFYVGERIFDDVKLILSNQHNIRLHEFTARQTPNERRKLLAEFEQGEIQSLVAMKCLDEGIDVPPTRTAYFLASSGNPREFIQRRGRILRKFEGKKDAIVYDLISIPPMVFVEQGKSGEKYRAAKSAMTRELKRVREFASMAKNKHSAMDELIDIINKLEILDKIN